MNAAEQIQFLTNGRDQRISKALEYWIRTSERFAGFVERYRDKIRKKCISAKFLEDLEDVRFELEIPYLLLLDDRFRVEYEKFGVKKRRAPDFTVSFESSFEFNLEVKRIREGGLGQRYNIWREEVVERIRKIPSSLAFAIDMVGADGTSDLICSLEQKKDDIISFIGNTIRTEAPKMPDDTASEYQVPGLDGKFVLVLTKPSRKRSTEETSYHGGIEPIFYTSKEPIKFGDAIFDKLGQMIPGMVNILVCTLRIPGKVSTCSGGKRPRVPRISVHVFRRKLSGSSERSDAGVSYFSESLFFVKFERSFLMESPLRLILCAL